MENQMRINYIELENTLPNVFLNEKIPPSEIWRKRVRFERGGRYLVEAASGTGKSSLCAYVFGARTDFDGDILFGIAEGKSDSDSSPKPGKSLDIRGIKPEEWQKIRRENIAYLPQELALFPELTAIQNIRLKNNLTGYVAEEQIAEWLARLGIDSRADYPVGKMSIGQQQRVAIIRSICQPFDFLILDEPVSHLDEENNRIAAAILESEARRNGAAIIATSVGNPLMLENQTLMRL